MDKDLWATGYVQADETPIRCLDPERPGGSFRGYLWSVTGPPGSDVIFRWADNRGHEVFKDWLPVDFHGVVQRDGYPAYATVARQRGCPSRGASVSNAVSSTESPAAGMCPSACMTRPPIVS